MTFRPGTVKKAHMNTEMDKTVIILVIMISYPPINTIKNTDLGYTIPKYQLDQNAVQQTWHLFCYKAGINPSILCDISDN